jgi:integrase
MLDYNVDGKRIREAVGKNKRDAELLQSKIQSDLTLGKFKIPNEKVKAISLDELIIEFKLQIKHTVRNSTFHRYENYITPFQNFMNEYFPAPSKNIRLIKSNYIKACIDDLLEENEENEKVWSKKTVNGMIVILKQLFAFAEKNDYLDENPLNDIKSFKIDGKGKIEFFTEDELKNIWEKVDKFWVDPLRFLVNTGLRKGELINLRWENVDLNPKNPHIVITSNDKWKTKTGNIRAVPLNKTALEIIKRAKGKNPEYVFTSKNNLKIHPDKPLYALKKALKKLGLTGDVHKLRHTFASQLIMKGESLYTIGKLLGHTDSETTQIYAHLSPGHLQESVAKLEG